MVLLLTPGCAQLDPVANPTITNDTSVAASVVYCLDDQCHGWDKGVRGPLQAGGAQDAWPVQTDTRLGLLPQGHSVIKACYTVGDHLPSTLKFTDFHGCG